LITSAAKDKGTTGQRAGGRLFAGAKPRPGYSEYDFEQTEQGDFRCRQLA
jgi:hypothetical protein